MIIPFLRVEITYVRYPWHCLHEDNNTKKNLVLFHHLFETKKKMLWGRGERGEGVIQQFKPKISPN